MSDDRTEIFIIPGRATTRTWQDFLAYRELFLFLVWRDVLVRYKQTVLGLAWCLLRPLLTMIVFSVVFGRLAGFPTEGGAPYPILVLAGLLPWQLFAGAVGDSSNSLIGNASLIAKVYFPRLIIPVSAVMVSLVDFAVSLATLIGLMFWYGYLPGWRIVALPLFLLMALLTALSLGLWASALSVKYRDFRFIVPFALQFGLYLSPVGFSSRVVPDEWLWLYTLNPLVGIIDGFRWALLQDAPPLYLPGLANATALTVLIGIGGLLYFQRTEQRFADII
jgi:lipopolysaccharide transport system permease protein